MENESPDNIGKQFPRWSFNKKCYFPTHVGLSFLHSIVSVKVPSQIQATDPPHFAD